MRDVRLEAVMLGEGRWDVLRTRDGRGRGRARVLVGHIEARCGCLYWWLDDDSACGWVDLVDDALDAMGGEL